MDNSKTGLEEQAAKKSGILTNPIRNLIITAIVSAALGVVFLIQPYFMLNYCGYALGGLIAVTGVVYIFIYFIRKPVSGVFHSEFAIGIILLAVGVCLVFASYEQAVIGISITLRMVVTALGILIAVDGVIKLQYALDLARMHYTGWWVAFLCSILGIALGVLTALGLVDSFGALVGSGSSDFINAMLFLGIGFCINAALDFFTMLSIVVRNHKAAKAQAAAAAAAMPSYYDPAPPQVVMAPAPAPAPAASAPATPAPAPQESENSNAEN